MRTLYEMDGNGLWWKYCFEKVKEVKIVKKSNGDVFKKRHRGHY